MKKKHIKFLLLLVFINSYAQPKTEVSNQPTHDISQKNDSKYDIEIERLIYEIKNLNEKLTEQKEDFNLKIENQKSDLTERLNLYLLFIGLTLSLIAWAINFFGKLAIKKRVEEIIEKTAEDYAEKKILEILNSKITDEYTAEIIKQKGEPEIDRLLKELEEKGTATIIEIRKKGNEVINSVWANPGNQAQHSLATKSDEQIKEYKEILRVDEFFDLAFKTKDPNIKIGLYKSVLELEESNVAALNNIGAAYNEIYQYNNAIEVLSKAVELNPLFGLAFANRANTYNQLDKLEEAMADVEKAIEAEPKLELAYAIKGNILTKQGNFVEAENSLTMAIELNPESAIAYFNRGYFNEETKKYIDSEKDYIKAKELGYENKSLLFNNLAVLFRRKRDFDKALIYINNAREVNPDFPNIDGTLALIYADLDDEENFYKYLKIALEKGCPVWKYLSDYGFDKYRDSQRLQKLIEPYETRYNA